MSAGRVHGYRGRQYHPWLKKQEGGKPHRDSFPPLRIETFSYCTVPKTFLKQGSDAWQRSHPDGVLRQSATSAHGRVRTEDDALK